jgi:DNA-binding NtrC family response regulator
MKAKIIKLNGRSGNPKEHARHDNYNKSAAATTTAQPGERKDALSDKISSLKQNAFALIQEVKELGNLSYLDLTSGIDLYEEVHRFEVRLIQQALEETDGHQVQAARLLGLNITTLNAKIKRYGIDPHEPLKEEHFVY